MLLAAPGVNLALANGNGWTPLMFACRHGHDDIVDLLLRAGASANQRAYDGATALYIAAQNGHAAAATRLLRAPGIDVSLTPRNGFTPLRVAQETGRAAVVAALLAHARQSS